MHIWYQDLTDQGKKFTKHFRGSVGSAHDKTWFKYEFSRHFNLRLSFEAHNHKTAFVFGMIFFTLYLTIYKLKIPFIPKGRETGFYWHEGTFWWFINRNADMCGSKLKHEWTGTIEPAKVVFGKQIYYKNELMKNYHPIDFNFRGKLYTMNEIKLFESFWFRSRVPYGLMKTKRISLDLKIDKPPMHQGKGENSYDCGDDGTFGIHAPYEGPEIKHGNKEEIFDYCCKYYCDNASKSIQKRGRVNDDRLLPSDKIGYKYIGWTKDTPRNDVGVGVGQG